MQLLHHYKKTAYQISKATGIPQSTFTDWKNGKSSPKLEKLTKIADYFNVSVDYLLGKTDKKAPPSEDGGAEMSDEIQKLAARFDKLSESSRRDVLNYMEFLVEKQKSEQEKS